VDAAVKVQAARRRCALLERFRDAIDAGISTAALRAAGASAVTCREQRDERDRWYEAEAAATNEIISVGIKQMGAIADLYGEDDDLDFGFWPTRLRSSTAGTATTATPLPVPTSKKAAVGMELLAEAWTEHDDRLTDVRTRE
jgi:hypothetical protein